MRARKVLAAEQAQRGPRGNNKRDDQRKQHGGRSADRDWPHIRTHEPSHKGHRQNGGDDGESCEDGGITDFGYGFYRNFAERPAAVRGHAEVANHVFDDNNGIVYEDADTEDQRKEGDTIEG